MCPIVPADPLCLCGHRRSSHDEDGGDTRCLAVEHPADLLYRFDDGREPGDLAYCGCLRFREHSGPVKSPRAGGHRAGANTEEDPLDAPEP